MLTDVSLKNDAISLLFMCLPFSAASTEDRLQQAIIGHYVRGFVGQFSPLCRMLAVRGHFDGQSPRRRLTLRLIHRSRVVCVHKRCCAQPRSPVPYLPECLVKLACREPTPESLDAPLDSLIQPSPIGTLSNSECRATNRESVRHQTAVDPSTMHLVPAGTPWQAQQMRMSCQEGLNG